MSENEKDTERNFLSRWSQRKREAKLPDADADAAATPTGKEANASPAQIAASETEEKFDLSSLPKLEEITESTDITNFLRKGVPESVRNAALRKSWALDPAIRNYVNPALDYAYDWNTPGGVPGNSELAAGIDVAKMVLQIMGSDPAAVASQEVDKRSPGDEADSPREIADNDASQNPSLDLPLQPVRLSDRTPGSAPALVDLQQPEHAQVEKAEREPPSEPSAVQHQVRRHGTAKPRT